MLNGPFRGFSVIFDFAVPVSVAAAIWLFGYGLAGLLGCGKRQKI